MTERSRSPRPKRRLDALPVRPLPPPDTTYSVAEAALEAGITVRTVRYWVGRRALPKVRAGDFRGVDTRYGRDFVLRLRAIARLLRADRDLPAAVAAFDAATEEERIRMAGYEPPREPPKEAAEETAPELGADPTQPRKLPAGFAGPYRSPSAYPAERFDHVPICPGVTLIVKTEADAEAHRVAREIVALFGTTSG